MWLIPSGLIGAVLKFFDRDTILICSLLGADVNGFNSKIGMVIKSMIFKKTNHLICQSKTLGAKAIECGYVKELHFLPLSIDCDQYKPNPNRARNNSSFPELLFVGTLNERKGIKNLIEACGSIKTQFPQFKLKVIGGGPLERNLKEIINRLQLEQQVEFLGYRKPEDLPHFFSNCDIFILPSLSEGLPLVVISALSSGCITMVTDLNAYQDLVKEFPNILHLIPESNPLDIKNKLFDIVANFEKNRELALENVKVIQHNFDNKIVISKYCQLLKQNG